MIETYAFGEHLGHARPLLDDKFRQYAPQDPNFVFISPDVGRAGMPNFIKEFPEQYFNTGIAEMASADLACGLAMEGYKPVIYGMSAFMSMRACEGIRTSICYQNANVTVIGNNTGLSQGPCGSTHYALEDLAIVRSFPNIILCCPGDPEQTLKAFEAAMEYTGPVYIRMANGRNEPSVYKSDYEFKFGKSITVKDGGDAVIIACGIMLAYALEAAKQLETENIHVRVIDMHTIKPLDEEAVCNAARETGRIVTVEDAFITGGLGGAVCETVAGSGIPCKVKRLGVPSIFPGFGSFQDQMDHLGYGIEAMKAAIRSF